MMARSGVVNTCPGCGVELDFDASSPSAAGEKESEGPASRRTAASVIFTIEVVLWCVFFIADAVIWGLSMKAIGDMRPDYEKMLGHFSVAVGECDDFKGVVNIYVRGANESAKNNCAVGYGTTVGYLSMAYFGEDDRGSWEDADTLKNTNLHFHRYCAAMFWLFKVLWMAAEWYFKVLAPAVDMMGRARSIITRQALNAVVAIHMCGMINTYMLRQAADHTNGMMVGMFLPGRALIAAAVWPAGSACIAIIAGAVANSVEHNRYGMIGGIFAACGCCACFACLFVPMVAYVVYSFLFYSMGPSDGWVSPRLPSFDVDLEGPTDDLFLLGKITTGFFIANIGCTIATGIATFVLGGGGGGNEPY